MAFYQQAIELDPDFALAHAGVANTFALRASMYGAGDEWAEKSIQQAALQKQRQYRLQMHDRVAAMINR